MKIAVAFLLAVLLVPLCWTADDSASVKRYTVAEMEAAILSGKIGPDLATYAQKVKKHGAELYVREVTGQPIPFQLFTFSMYRGYTVLVEPSDRIVILCSSVGGGYITDVRLTSAGKQQILHYRYTSGSGRLFEHRAEYVIGSGSPKEVAPIKDITPR